MTRRRVWLGSLALGALLALPTAALAQSSIGGTVKDDTGGVLPGVTVEVSSPSIIEGTKTATTDGGGGYRVTDLRPGMYTVRFSLTGFATVERAAFQLLTDFNARIDAEMKVGTLQETVTVTGAAPIVDVQSAVKVSVLDRDALDNVPTGRSIFGLGQLILGVALSAPDVGGSASAMSQYMSMRGGSVSSANNTVMVDGMQINGLQSDGAVQTYINDSDFQEMSYQTAGAGADRSGGGVALNMIPKEGGNRLSGDGQIAIRPGQTQGDNYTDRLKLWGLPVDKFGQPAVNRIDHVYDMSGSGGGPLKKDKLWFFLSGRNQEPVNTVPNTFLDNGHQGLDDNYIRQSAMRATYQMSSRHKFGAYYERVFKWRGHDMGAYDDPETVAGTWTSPNYSTMSAKYTGTLSSKLLVEGGFSQNTEYYRVTLQPAVDKPRAADMSCVTSSAWCGQSSHVSATGGGAGVARATSTKSFPVSEVISGSVSYVTGSHHAKAGMAYKFGKYGHGTDANGDLQQSYPSFNRVTSENYAVYFPISNRTAMSDAQYLALFPPAAGFTPATTFRPCDAAGALGLDGIAVKPTGTTCTVLVRNTPVLSQEHLNQDLGIYIQDSYTMKRVTVNAGIRYETLNSQVDAYSTGASGRFSPSRTIKDGKNIPDWKDWAPRFQMVFDVFGDSRTAVKYSFNRYNEAATVGLAQTFNPLGGATSSRNWTDLNQDDIAQGQRTFAADNTPLPDCIYPSTNCEINLSGLGAQTALIPTFGLPADQAAYQGYPRRYRLEQGIEVQHALLPRLSISGTYYKGWNKNRTKTISVSQLEDGISGGTVGSQFTKLSLFNPIDGTPFYYYNRTVGAFPGANSRTYVEPEYKSTYDSYSADFQMRPYAGAQVGGGIGLERTLDTDCTTSYKRTAADDAAVPAGAGLPAFVGPTSLRFCDDRNYTRFAFIGGAPAGIKLSKAFTKSFKLSGTFPTVYRINVGFSYQNLDGGALAPTFLYGNSASVNSLPTNATPMLAGAAFVQACPTAYGCVPGAISASVNPLGTAGGTALALFPTGYVRGERINQLDVQGSRTFRFGRWTIQPKLEAFNLLNIDEVRGRASSQIGANTYMQPSSTLQGRVLGFGANIKW